MNIKPVFTEAPLVFQGSPCGFLVDKVALGQCFSPSTSVFPLSVSFHRCSMIIFIRMFLLPEGQTGEAWELFKSSAVSENGVTLDRKALYLFYCFVALFFILQGEMDMWYRHAVSITTVVSFKPNEEVP